MFWAQNLINGLLLGSVYTIIGMSFTLIYGILGIINIAHGSLIMLGAYVTFTLFEKAAIDPFVSLPIVLALLFGLGFVTQKYALSRIMRYGLPLVMVATFGLDMVLINVALAIWSADYRAINTSYAQSFFSVGGLVFPYIRTFTLLASIGITVALYFFLFKTKTGNAIRAVALNKDAARLAGVDIELIYALSFGIAAALAGVAGSLFGYIYPIHPFMGVPLLGKAFAIAVLGGLGNVTGAIIAGFILGLAEVLGAAVLGTQYQYLISYGIFFLVLLLVPRGIAGRRYF